ncbi:AAA family ATPase [Paraburkholderia sp. C35]|uniref:AAA family ATPase n=1 Tax=Paraburkholderia sp. C35 TaxID=2126993 RepID=UPI000D6A01A5|nr:AAA family ATPase [Paraburkholderia sp. C35]
MESSSNGNVHAVPARYTEQRIPMYKGNRLIAALFPTPGFDELVTRLNRLPEFDEEQRHWPIHERLQMVGTLSNCMVVLQRHIELAWVLDTMMRQGYVGREPRTREHTMVYQRLYEARKAGLPFGSRELDDDAPQLSSSLLGFSGIGKTYSLKQILRLQPQVIYHSELDITQITYIRIETPHDGTSIKGFALAIIRKIHQLIPDGNYYELYGKSTSSNEVLLGHAAHLMHTHCVGLLVADEIQNLKNAGGGKSRGSKGAKESSAGARKLMALFVSASNDLGIPILYVGTNRAEHVLQLDASPARRSVGGGTPNWEPLKATFDLAKPGEWEEFISTIWPFQWVQKPVPLTQALSDLMYHYCQGVIDLAIKLFASTQGEAMLTDAEEITAQLIEQVWETKFERVHAMMDAYRSGDTEALEQYEDIAPLSAKAMLSESLSRYEGVRSPMASVRPGHRDFVSTVSSTLQAMGVDAGRAEEIATSVEEEGKVRNVSDGVQTAINKMKPPKAPGRKRSTKKDVESLNLAPDDYRNAIAAAREKGTSVFEQLELMGAVTDLNDLLELD